MIRLQRPYLLLELTIHTLNFRLPLKDSKHWVMEYNWLSNIKLLNCRFQGNFPSFYFFCPRILQNMNLIRILSVSKMGKCPFKPRHIWLLYELSHLLHWLFARITRRKEKTEVVTFSYLVKIIGTHLETIIDGGFCFRSIFKIIGHVD